MALDFAKIQARLQTLKEPSYTTSGGANSLLWKPSAGVQVIRILPYIHQPDFPFVDLQFYYEFGKTMLAPCAEGRPDPVAEFVAKLRSTRDKEDFKSSLKFTPKKRTLAAILVRGTNGQPDEFKVWSFGPKIFTEILTIMDDPDYGDITDPKTGRDISLTYLTAQQTSNGFPDTKLVFKPKQTIATDDPELLEKIKNMPKFNTLYTEPTYDELKIALEAYLRNSVSDGTAPQSTVASTKKDDTFIKEMNAPVKATNKKRPEDVVAEFDDLFND